MNDIKFIEPVERAFYDGKTKEEYHLMRNEQIKELKEKLKILENERIDKLYQCCFCPICDKYWYKEVYNINETRGQDLILACDDCKKELEDCL